MRKVSRMLTLTAALLCAPPLGALTDDEANTIAAHGRVARSVVLILVSEADPEEPEPGSRIRVRGSGFAVEPGLVVTNFHVIEEAARIEVALPDGDRADAVVVGTAPGFDLALLRVPFGADRLPPAMLGAGPRVQVGQKVMTVSNALGIWHSLTVGVVSGMDRELPGLELGASLIQFDAPLNPGQSGGPLVDSDGRVVGITTAKITGAEAIGFAIPVDVLTRILPDLEEMGHPFRPQLGLRGAGIGPDLASLFGLPVRTGVLVEEVEPGSPAERSGLVGGHRRIFLGGREYVLGGDIIVAVDGAPLLGSEEFVLRLLASRPDQRIELSVLGAGGPRKVNLTVPRMVH